MKNNNQAKEEPQLYTNSKPPELKGKFKEIATILIFIVLIVSIAAAALYNRTNNPNIGKLNDSDLKMFKFQSQSEFKEYLSKSPANGASSFSRATDLAGEESLNFAAPTAGQGDGGAARVSQTNIQVQEIDEPDIVKTDGENIYYSQEYFYDILPFDVVRPELSTEPNIVEDLIIESEESIAPRVARQPDTKVLKAFPPENLSSIANIQNSGEMLLSNNHLVFIESGKLTSFDVADPSTPTESWAHTFDQQEILESRLYEGKLYIVTRRQISPNSPCPIPLISGSRNITIACTEIYHPNRYVPTNVLHTVLKINPDNGNVESTTAFTGSYDSVVYMSSQNLFITNSERFDQTSFQIQFFESSGESLLPGEYAARIINLKNLDISTEAKQTELQVILSEFMQTLNEDQVVKFQTNLENQLGRFAQNNAREYEKTIITKINLKDFASITTGQIPGRPLNQFSVDEWEGTLRIATTIGAQTFLPGLTSINDVYTLNGDLKQIGSITDLGLDERIYSARFIGDTGYLVTFKQIDPFYVLNLSNPNSPKMEGELKIPGFSSYLHPIDDNTVLGVGREDSRVKITLFDVSNHKNPTELNTFYLSDFWTDVESNHHAFLLDDKHKVFFLPAGQNGYVISYENKTLEIVATVAGTNAQRAVFLDDFLYILGQKEVRVLDEQSWVTVNSLSLQ